jgi:hypothetical protein
MEETLTFESHGTRCVATLQLPNKLWTNPCFVMGHGFQRDPRSVGNLSTPGRLAPLVE